MNKLMLLIVLSALAIGSSFATERASAQPLNKEPEAFAGPVRYGEKDGVRLTLSGFSLRSQVEETVKGKRRRTALRGRVSCRMEHNETIDRARVRKPSESGSEGARWNFDSPLMTVGEGYCRLRYKGNKIKIFFQSLEVVQ